MQVPFNVYGSQMEALPKYQSQNEPMITLGENGAQSQKQDSVNSIESTASTSKGSSKGKGPAKASYETMDENETKLLVNLWIENHASLESKDSRKTWTKIVNKLNEQYKKNRTTDKCKRRMKYLLEKYKERKDWNQKQSGGNVWKSPFYDELDAILGTWDVITFQHVEEVQADSPNTENNSSSESTSTESSPSNSTATGPQKRKERKRKRGLASEFSDDERKVMKSLTDQGEKITSVISKMQETQAKQVEMMSTFMDAMVKMMSQSK